jgi:hypothetical protein
MSLDTSCSKADLPRPLLFVRPFDCVSIARRDTAILEIEQAVALSEAPQIVGRHSAYARVPF